MYHCYVHHWRNAEANYVKCAIRFLSIRLSYVGFSDFLVQWRWNSVLRRIQDQGLHHAHESLQRKPRRSPHRFIISTVLFIICQTCFCQICVRILLPHVLACAVNDVVPFVQLSRVRREILNCSKSMMSYNWRSESNRDKWQTRKRPEDYLTLQRNETLYDTKMLCISSSNNRITIMNILRGEGVTNGQYCQRSAGSLLLREIK